MSEQTWAIGWLVTAGLLGVGGALVVVTRPSVARVILGLFWLPMAAINVTVGLLSPDGYAGMADDSSIPGFDTLFRSVVELLSPTGFGLAAAAYQFTIALLVLGTGKAVKVGLIGSALYLAGVAGLGLPYLPTLFVAVPYVLLLRAEFDTGLFDSLHLPRPRAEAAA